MAGAFTSGETPEDIAMAAKDPPATDEPQKIETDIEGVFADGMKNNMPVFDVDQRDFYSNMKHDRKRIRFTGGTPASEFMRQSKYNKPFWVRTKTDKGDFMRKIK
jgi:hypothetical protein